MCLVIDTLSSIAPTSFASFKMSNDIEANPKNAAPLGIESAPMRDAEKDLIKKNDAAYKVEAVLAENAEHGMTVLQAARAYPMACFWAFIMSSTIVSGYATRKGWMGDNG